MATRAIDKLRVQGRGTPRVENRPLKLFQASIEQANNGTQVGWQSKKLSGTGETIPGSDINGELSNKITGLSSTNESNGVYDEYPNSQFSDSRTFLVRGKNVGTENELPVFYQSARLSKTTGESNGSRADRQVHSEYTLRHYSTQMSEREGEGGYLATSGSMNNLSTTSEDSRTKEPSANVNSRSQKPFYRAAHLRHSFHDLESLTLRGRTMKQATTSPGAYNTDLDYLVDKEIQNEWASPRMTSFASAQAANRRRKSKPKTNVDDSIKQNEQSVLRECLVVKPSSQTWPETHSTTNENLKLKFFTQFVKKEVPASSSERNTKAEKPSPSGYQFNSINSYINFCQGFPKLDTFPPSRMSVKNGLVAKIGDATLPNKFQKEALGEMRVLGSSTAREPRVSGTHRQTTGRNPRATKQSSRVNRSVKSINNHEGSDAQESEKDSEEGDNSVPDNSIQAGSSDTIPDDVTKPRFDGPSEELGHFESILGRPGQAKSDSYLNSNID
ncbi:uncharacterized protein LOC131939194 [Physella acuta]|uniref:uncharacterized protein LOC131939194 n=1 Tax=Physella acuta TaxID=109671 RepID=UPI0027DC278F|nr:uncharacterized protein LOC131939194 [Physella acuta]